MTSPPPPSPPAEEQAGQTDGDQRYHDDRAMRTRQQASGVHPPGETLH